MGLGNEQCLYTNVQNVVMPNGITKDLRIDISGFGKPISKVEVRITDESDPSLLYILHVSESDFNVIKSQQGLLVDFSNFPIHLVKLLEQCLSGGKGFLLTLEENGLESYMKVVQPIDLKNLCYIALRIGRGSDAEIMRHMHNQILLIKKKLSSREEECHCMQSQLGQLQQELAQKQQQNEMLKKQWEEEQTRLKAQFSKETEVLKEQLLQERKRDLDSAAYQREGLNTKIEDLSREATKYKNKHMQISEKYEQAQQTIRELSMRTSSSEEMHKAISRELTDLRRHKTELESECRKKDQDINQAHSHAESLDKEIARLRTRLTRQEGQLREADAEQVRLKSAVTRLQETVEGRNDLVLQLNGDLTKANLIIKERQKELDKMHNELKKIIASKHDEEDKLKNLELEMKILRKNSERDKIRIKSLEEIEGKLQEQLKAANETISAKDEQHKKCGDLISYLNRSLNRQHLDPSPPTTAHGHSVLHSSAPPAPILYTLGSSLGRAGFGTAPALHMSGPPITNMPGNTLGRPQPFSSTPLVASAAAGGTGVGTRRSYPGALMHPSGTVPGSLSAGTPAARPAVDRMNFSEPKPQKQVTSPPHSSYSQNIKKVMPKARSQSSLGVASSNQSTSNAKKTERAVKGQSADKENKESTTYKPSAYFQPNKIITEF